MADTGNNRVQIFNPAASINNDDTASVSISGLGAPASITSNAAGFWVANAGQNQLLHYPAVSQLGLVNNASNASQPALGPFSAFLDSYSNLLVADNANRVLYFAPGLSVVSSASYSPRALTAGMTASVFPATQSNSSSSGSMPNIIAAGTGTFSMLPLPYVLGDTQVLVNNTAAPLFYVSPGQINLVLPNELPTGGTANLEIMRQSTGQISGAPSCNWPRPIPPCSRRTRRAQVRSPLSTWSTAASTHPPIPWSVAISRSTAPAWVL